MSKHDEKKLLTSGEEPNDPIYKDLLSGVSTILETARKNAARSVNAIMTATYWQIGKRIVEVEQGGEARADYGTRLIERLAHDLTSRFGRGFSRDNLESMRLFYQAYPQKSLDTKSETMSRISGSPPYAPNSFALGWSHYVCLVRKCRSQEAHAFYEQEALRGGWTVRQLERQINSQFYERVELSNDKFAMLQSGEAPEPNTQQEHPFQDPLVLEFLDLKDEYSETDLENALVLKLEDFLMELGGDFTFVGRQRRLRIGTQ